MAVKRWVVCGLVAAVCGSTLPGARGEDSPRAHYETGLAEFQKGDFAAAGRDLVALAPFDGEYGGRARYLLGRIHQLSNERPEAQADYHAVLAWWQAHKTADAKMPDYVQHAGFYDGVLSGEQGKIAEAIERLRTWAGPASTDINTPLGAQALLRIGLLQVQNKEYAPAIKTLEPLKGHALFADQALWFTARAQILAAPTDTPQNHRNAITQGAQTLKQAADKALELGKSDAAALLRRADELLELGDAQMSLRQFDAGAQTFATVAAEFEKVAAGRDRAQEAMARQVTALALAGKYPECEALAAAFQKQWPGSVLSAGVLFREAQSVYLQAAQLAPATPSKEAQSAAPLLQGAIKKFSRLVEEFPEYAYVSQARMNWATALYQLGRYHDAADVLAGIPGSDRSGELAVASLMQGDCLLRTLPPEGNDALSAARMLMQAEQAAAALAEFVTANPGHPETPQANFKLGYCYQRIAGALADNNADRWKTWQQARACYDKVLAAVPWENPVAAETTLERAQVLQSIGDMTAAVGELRKFQSDPLAKAANAPLALLRLSMLLRMQGKAPEAADILATWRAGHETAALADPALAGCVPTIEYEQALALKDAGKPADARAIFTAIAGEYPRSRAGINSQWRLAQSDRDVLMQRLTEARWRLGAARRPSEKLAAQQALDATADGVKQWIAATSPQATEALRQEQASAGEGAVRLSYELAWGYRMLGEIAAENARNPTGVETAPAARQSVSMSVVAAGNSSSASGGVNLPLPEPELQARNAFLAVIQAGDKGGLAEQETANLARLDLGEMLAQRGLVDPAMDLFTEALERGLQGNSYRDSVRPRLRIAECLLAKHQPAEALTQVALTVRAGGQPPPEGRYLVGEAYIQLNQLRQAREALRPFEDERSFYAGEVGDRGLLRLGDVLLREGNRAEAVYAYTTMLKKYPRSQLASAARLKLVLCKLTTWQGIK